LNPRPPASQGADLVVVGGVYSELRD